MGQTVAVVLAGGRGQRVGAGRNKVLLTVAGRPVIEWSVRAFAAHPAIDRTVLVAHPDDEAELTRIAAGYRAVSTILGGKERADSERAALDYLRADIEAGAVDAVLLHDGARPCVSGSLIARAAESSKAAGVVPVLAAPVLVRAAEPGAALVAEPGRLMRAQTPQGGPALWLLAAYDEALRSGFAGTDTASYLEHAGYAVAAIAGEESNLKVTYREDLRLAADLLRRTAPSARNHDV